MTVDPKGDGARLHCFKCGFHGDIVDLVKLEYGYDTKAAFDYLYRKFSLDVDAPKDTTGGFREYYRVCRDRIEDKRAVDYLKGRGISLTVAKKYGLGFDPEADPATAPGAIGSQRRAHPCPRIIVPFDASHYMGRSVDPDTESNFRKLNSKKLNPDERVPMFNAKALQKEGDSPLFVVEGAFSALSVLEAGEDAVALNSVGNYELLVNELKKRPIKRPIVISLDNDQPGQDATKKLTHELDAINVPYRVENISGAQNDPNDHLQWDRDGFINAVRTISQDVRMALSRPDNSASYIRNGIARDIYKLRKQAELKTGFDQLDKEAGSLYAGLYVIGGVSSVGKTTFLLQLADQIAAQGRHVIFFSLEQSRLELVTKSIARTIAEAGKHDPISSLAIRTGTFPEYVADAADDYARDVGERVNIVEGNFQTTPSSIVDYVRRYVRVNRVRPVICVDYLQVIQPDTDPETGRRPYDLRQSVDSVVIALKRLSRDLQTPVFVVSSMNRASYTNEVSFESFKESGMIEYSCDVLWGLQLSVLHNEAFKGETDQTARREMLARAKVSIPRFVELSCLKNRFGKARYSVNFSYDPRYDIFKEYNANQPQQMTPLVGIPTPFDEPVRTF